MGKLYTLSVGQGNFAILQGQSEVIVIDTHLPAEGAEGALYVQGLLSEVAKGRNVVGVILTGFDADHAEPQGLGMILKRYNPYWLMYPKYYKGTRTADAVFKLIEEENKRRTLPMRRYSISLKQWKSFIPLVPPGLSKEFNFYPFSPYPTDETTSNNASLVVKIVDRATGHSLLVTGDTEEDRWNDICKYFARDLASDILQAPHHGSRSGITRQAFRHIQPHTVLISAGEGNQFGHPHREALEIFDEANGGYSTHQGDSWVTEWGRTGIMTSCFKGE